MSDIRGSVSQIILTPEAFFPTHFARGSLSIITLGKGFDTLCDALGACAAREVTKTLQLSTGSSDPAH